VTFRPQPLGLAAARVPRADTQQGESLSHRSSILGQASARPRLRPAAPAVALGLGLLVLALTGLPFVWAFWAGRPGVLSPDALAALGDARDAGVAGSDAIANAYGGPDRAALNRAYLRDNIKYVLGEREAAGLQRYYDLAEKHGVIERVRTPVFF